MKKILVLSSGGLDSTVLLYKAVKEVGADNVIALNIYYGQKHDKEMEYANWQYEHLGIRSYTCNLAQAFSFNVNSCSLIKGSNKEIKHETYAQQLEADKFVNSYVPFRNGLFLSYAASVAIQLGCDDIYYGAHADDAAGNAYPDCSPDFIEHMTQAIKIGTAETITMRAPLWKLNKAGVVKLGLELGMTHEEFEHTWSCYEGKETPCGTCGTCRDRRAAFEANGITDIA